MYLILTAMLNIQYVLDLLDYSRSNLLKDPFTFILVSLRDLLRHNFSQILISCRKSRFFSLDHLESCKTLRDCVFQNLVQTYSISRLISELQII